MATDKKHIAVYLDPAVEVALVAFCEHKGLKSKKGIMFSAGVNAALAEFFGVISLGTDSSNRGTRVSVNIQDLALSTNIPPVNAIQLGASFASNIPPANAIQLGVSSATKRLAEASNTLAPSNIPPANAIQLGVSSATKRLAEASNTLAPSNIPPANAIQLGVGSVSNTLAEASNRLPASNIPSPNAVQLGVLGSLTHLYGLDVANILPKSLGVDVLPRTPSLSDVEVDALIHELEAVRIENQRLHMELGNSESEKQSLQQELVQVRSQLEQERADREKFQSEVSVLNAKLAAALEQNEKLAPIVIGVELQSQLEQERADRQIVEAELSKLKQNSVLVAASTLWEKLAPDAATILDQVRGRRKRKKSKIDLWEVEAVLEILQTLVKKIEEE